MKKVIAALMLLTGGVGIAAPAPYPITINSRAATAPPVLVFRASESLFRAYYTDGPTASDITGDAPFMAWFTNDTAVTVSTAAFAVVGNASTGVVDFTFPSASVNYTPGLYGYEIGVKSATGTPRVYKQGAFTIEGSPYSTGADPADWGTNLNWATVALFLNPEYGPSIGDDVTIVAMSTNDRGQLVLSAIGTLATNAIPYLVHLGTNYGESGNIVTFSGTAVTRGGANHLVFTDTPTNGLAGLVEMWDTIGATDTLTRAYLLTQVSGTDTATRAWVTVGLTNNTYLTPSAIQGLPAAWANSIGDSNSYYVLTTTFDLTNTAIRGELDGIDALLVSADLRADTQETATVSLDLRADTNESDHTSFDLRTDTNDALLVSSDLRDDTNEQAIVDLDLRADTNEAAASTYLLTNGARAMSGDLNMGGYAITNGNYLELIGSNGVNLVANGTFDSEDHWNIDADWWVAAGVIIASGGANPVDADFSYESGIEVGKTYFWKADVIVQELDVALKIYLGGDLVDQFWYPATNTVVGTLVATATDAITFSAQIPFGSGVVRVDNVFLYDLTASETIFPKDIRDWKIAATGKTDLVTFNALSNQVQGVAGSLSTISNRVVGAISTNSESWSITYPTNAVTYRMFSTPANGTLTKVEVASTIGGTLNLVAQPKSKPITTYSIICTNVAFSPTGTVASTTWIASTFAKTNWLGVRFMTRNGYPVADTNNTTIMPTWTIP